MAFILHPWQLLLAALAVKANVLGRKVLQEIGTLFTPDTILRWHRQLVAQKWDYSERREKKPGRPPTPEEIAQSREIECRERLGGLLRYYYRKAA